MHFGYCNARSSPMERYSASTTTTTTTTTTIHQTAAGGIQQKTGSRQERSQRRNEQNTAKRMEGKGRREGWARILELPCAIVLANQRTSSVEGCVSWGTGGVARKKEEQGSGLVMGTKDEESRKSMGRRLFTDQESVGDYCTTYMRAAAPEGMRGVTGGSDQGWFW